jgi:hypothetical protein
MDTWEEDQKAGEILVGEADAARHAAHHKEENTIILL